MIRIVVDGLWSPSIGLFVHDHLGWSGIPVWRKYVFVTLLLETFERWRQRIHSGIPICILAAQNPRRTGNGRLAYFDV
jgi:hypothetical protein